MTDKPITHEEVAELITVATSDSGISVATSDSGISVATRPKPMMNKEQRSTVRIKTQLGCTGILNVSGNKFMFNFKTEDISIGGIGFKSDVLLSNDEMIVVRIDFSFNGKQSYIISKCKIVGKVLSTDNKFRYSAKFEKIDQDMLMLLSNYIKWRVKLANP
jgi:c-di-GMP-binding flagellar brake protein YcgR